MVKVVDVFAGPGGLNEGFSRFRNQFGRAVFEIAGSFEVDPVAVQTLTLRAAARAVGLTEDANYLAFMNGGMSRGDLENRPKFARALAEAGRHVHEHRLGPQNRDESDRIIAGSLIDGEPWVLIGGPPCQAYSLAGRSRMGRTAKFLEDERHFLFREYLHIIRTHRPTVFVMENVKGLLSATHRETRMFDLIMSDLSCNGDYEIRSLVVSGNDPLPRDFVIEAEKYGVPQKRHRVILLGVRRDAALGKHKSLTPRKPVSLRTAIGHDLPKIRSQVSPKREDQDHFWLRARREAFDLAVHRAATRIEDDDRCPPSYSGPAEYVDDVPGGALTEWLRSPKLERVSLHEPRSHMYRDLVRYAYLAHMADGGVHPTVKELPAKLWPNHANVLKSNTPFVDRFKAQSWTGPSSTIVSHISKDGHHYIHPEAWQMRSLTLREAARLQTFPDDYFFAGNRTQQYHQVGNAVPPLLAFQIADSVADLLGLS